jgi:hypothetical protein
MGLSVMGGNIHAKGFTEYHPHFEAFTPAAPFPGAGLSTLPLVLGHDRVLPTRRCYALLQFNAFALWGVWPDDIRGAYQRTISPAITGSRPFLLGRRALLAQPAGRRICFS